MKCSCIGSLILTLFIAGCRFQEANSDLRMQLGTFAVQSVTVYQIPQTVSSPRNMTPEMLEHGYQAKYELRAAALHDQTEKLQEALANTDCEGNLSTNLDLRTAIIFFGADQKRLRSFYYGLGGRDGQIDDKFCHLGPGLYRWVHKTFSTE